MNFFLSVNVNDKVLVWLFCSILTMESLQTILYLSLIMGEECLPDSSTTGPSIDFPNSNARTREGKCECRHFLKLFITEICLPLIFTLNYRVIFFYRVHGSNIFIYLQHVQLIMDYPLIPKLIDVFLWLPLHAFMIQLLF